MLYRLNPKNGDRISALGFGCLRLSNEAEVSQEAYERVIKSALGAGINYFDTAWAYSGSEAMLGHALKKYAQRRDVFIATKCPPPESLNGNLDYNRFLEISLERLDTDYIDYYLMHNLSTASDPRLTDSMMQWANEQKERGRIKNLGFSYHGTREDFPDILNAYDWDFVLIQFNYLNVHHQAGEEGLKLAASKGMPVFIMEPLLGGALTSSLPKRAVDMLAAAFPKLTPAQCGLKWLYNYPEITMVLSGMTTPEMIAENCKAVDEPYCLSKRDIETFQVAEKLIRECNKIHCSGCRYCMPCPRGIDIAECFACYNLSFSVGLSHARERYIHARSSCRPDRCVKCGKCETACPQGIKIMSELVNVDRRLMTLKGKIKRYLSKRCPMLYRWLITILPRAAIQRLRKLVKHFMSSASARSLSK